MEVYKAVTIFTHETELMLKTFHGTAANHTDFFRYRSLNQLLAKVEKVKQSADTAEKWKAQRKEENKGKTSSHAGAAAAIKAELQKAYPGVKFSCTSESFSMGNSVHVSWTEGPTTEQVKNISSKYEYGHFNGMEDIYEYSNSREDIPQAKYVSESRTIKEETIKAIAENLQLLGYKPEAGGYRYEPENIARQIAYKTAFPNNYTSFELVKDYENSFGGIESLYKIVFQTPEEEKPAQEAKPTSAPATPGKIQFVDYSEKAFAVIGDFGAIYEQLINLGGKYNRFLKCGKGIIFSKKRMEDVKTFLLSTKEQQPQETESQEPEEVTAQAEEPAPPQAPKVKPEDILPTPENIPLNLDYLKIIWHEGRHTPGATFTGQIFDNWEEIQKAFFILWQVNEAGQDGGYTKVKVEIKQKNQESLINRIDITNRINNGDFNPTQEHIANYVQSIYQEEEETAPEAATQEQQQQEEAPKQYNNLAEIRDAARQGKLISLFNLSKAIHD